MRVDNLSTMSFFFHNFSSNKSMRKRQRRLLWETIVSFTFQTSGNLSSTFNIPFQGLWIYQPNLSLNPVRSEMHTKSFPLMNERSTTVSVYSFLYSFRQDCRNTLFPQTIQFLGSCSCTVYNLAVFLNVSSFSFRQI